MKNLNLENLKEGDEVVVIFVNPRRNRDGAKYHGPYKVILDMGGNFRLDSGARERIPKDGKGYYAMHSRETPHFYYSANPKHLAAARKERNKSLAKEKKKRDLLSQKRAAFSPLLEEYTDKEECYSFEYLSTDSLERLTLKQIETLKKWLAPK